MHQQFNFHSIALNGHFVTSLAVFALLALATTAPVPKAVIIVASKAKPSNPNKSITWLAPFSALYTYKRIDSMQLQVTPFTLGYSELFEQPQGQTKPYHWFASS